MKQLSEHVKWEHHITDEANRDALCRQANIKYVRIVHYSVIHVSCDFSLQTATKSKERERKRKTGKNNL